MNRKVHILLGGVLFTALLGGQGEAAAQKVYQLNPILVSATKYQTPDLKIPASTEVYDQEKIQQLGAQNVMEVVRNIPGFSFTASPTGNQYVGFRGQNRNYTAILVNGIPLAQDGNYDLESISSNTIDRIEVVKGGSAVLYGSSAMAGVINIITKKSANESKLILGGGDQHKLTGSLELGLDKLVISYNHNQARNFGESYRSTRYSYIGDKQKKDSLNVQYALTDQLLFQYMHTERSTDMSMKYPNGSIAPGFHSVIKYNFAQLHYSEGDLLGAIYFRSRDWKFNTTTHQKGTNYGLNLQNRWGFGETELTAGIEYEKESTQNSGSIPAAKRDSAAVFFMTNSKLNEQWNLLVGAREAYVEKSGSKFLPQLQLLYTPGSDDSYYLNINRSMRVPMVNEQWGTATQEMNPDLKAENGWNYEIGWKKILRNQDYLRFDIFHMDIKDRIYSKKMPSGLSKYFNANSYKNTGIELSYESSPAKKFVYNVGVSYANPQQKTVATGKWTRVDYKLGMNWGIGYKDDLTQAHLNFNYMGLRQNVDPLLNIDFSVSRKLSDADSMHLYVYNLLDRDDIRSSSATGPTGSILPERNWLLTFEHRF
ncbi:MAG: TonB-dependent receptor [Veillonellaceae bacterium]|nr:TonB-dependent receptor [Veillonellaceae bacterium]